MAKKVDPFLNRPGRPTAKMLNM